jgi:hypothetical protein
MMGLVRLTALRTDGELGDLDAMMQAPVALAPV